MKKRDISMLTDEEATVVDNSFDREGLPSRFRNMMLGAFLATAVVLLLLAFEASVTAMAVAAMSLIVIGSLEKVTYVRTQMNSRGAIRKLVHRIERLEGVPFTPDGGRPTKLAVARRDQAA